MYCKKNCRSDLNFLIVQKLVTRALPLTGNTGCLHTCSSYGLSSCVLDVVGLDELLNLNDKGKSEPYPGL